MKEEPEVVTLGPARGDHAVRIFHSAPYVHLPTCMRVWVGRVHFRSAGRYDQFISYRIDGGEHSLDIIGVTHPWNDLHGAG